MRKAFLWIMCGLLLIATPLSAAASGPQIIDDAGLLTDSQIYELEQRANDLANRYGMDVVILTVESIHGEFVQTYADDYYDQNGYGIGPDYSGLLLLLSMEYRDWAISTCGEAIYAFTDYGIQDVFSQISGYLSQEMYYLAFSTYLDAVEGYMEAYQNGMPLDGFAGEYYGPGSFENATPEDIIYYPGVKGTSWYAKKIILALAIGAVVAGIVLLVMRSKMNTATAQHGASSYMLKNTYRVGLQQDIFLYSQLRKVRKSENSSSGGHGGGSSVHHSSGGRSHGGGHGKF